jgi:hypothetical protein
MAKIMRSLDRLIDPALQPAGILGRIARTLEHPPLLLLLLIGPVSTAVGFFQELWRWSTGSATRSWQLTDLAALLALVLVLSGEALVFALPAYVAPPLWRQWH